MKTEICWIDGKGCHHMAKPVARFWHGGAEHFVVPRYDGVLIIVYATQRLVLDARTVEVIDCKVAAA